MTRIILIGIIACLEMVNSQYYSQPNTYQPYNYFPAPSVAPSVYTPPYYAPPPSPYSMPSYAPVGPLPTPYPPATYSYSPYPTSAIPSICPALPAPIYSSPSSSSTQVALPKSKYAPAAYYFTSPEPKSILAEKAKENQQELPPTAPTYPCPFCNGFANVPKNSKVPPPPPCSSVLPGILDKLPTLALPDELKVKDLCKFAKPCPLLADLFEHKLSGKLRFDEDLLDGFLTGLGLGK